MWILGGSGGFPSLTNDVWFSIDGANWIQATPNTAWSARDCHTSVSFNNFIWVIGGLSGLSDFKNDVWYSTGLGIEENHMLHFSDFSFQVFPNPASSFIVVRAPGTIDNPIIKLYDATGKLIKETRRMKQDTKISLDGIKNGVYFVKVGDELIKGKLVVSK
jgi:hypothetical protein